QDLSLDDEKMYRHDGVTLTSTLTHLSLMFTDAEVSCQFGQSCILPCSFTPGDHLEIHWIQLTPTLTEVHSYYDNKDQLEVQDQRFRGRTSLFQDQISKGNASLQLTGVMVQDEGIYHFPQILLLFRCGGSCCRSVIFKIKLRR
uniref:Immunoglobulin V-set domain-containing protein n=1 Tax=Oryzias latipes TaxID=8090 RepID=A0A3P9M993_ORYLA